MSTNEPPMTEEQLRAAYEEEIKRIRVEHVLIENVVTLVNLGMRRTGLMAGTDSERDPDQVRLAIESVRAVLPLLEPLGAEQVDPIKQALSQLQLAYVQITGPSGGSGESGPAGPDSGGSSQAPGPGEGPGPAQSSGRLWIPGQ